MGTRVDGFQTEIRARVENLQNEVRDQQQHMEGQLTQMMAEMRRMMNNHNHNYDPGVGRPPGDHAAVVVGDAGEAGLHVAPAVNLGPRLQNPQQRLALVANVAQGVLNMAGNAGINFIPEIPDVGVNIGGVDVDGVELGAARAYRPRPGMLEAMAWGNGGQMGFQQIRSNGLVQRLLGQPAVIG
ncbi:hypothetical protein O6P43_009201 [Quillaja saponaria]|uniref:Uncharacterized protein n=1 Tax=Quillaja saponaria TaxID=32244 RepID=A0AAD7VCM3_QUISA|nr:hypothetical protein O6P43_009201 [Quillaja saponaria]